jgi:hypothetical protein
MRRKNLLLWPSTRHFDISTTFFSINNNQFHSYIDLIYSNELEIKDTTECSTPA